MARPKGDGFRTQKNLAAPLSHADADTIQGSAIFWLTTTARVRNAVICLDKKPGTLGYTREDIHGEFTKITIAVTGQ
jgi:hypothetical protein